MELQILLILIIAFIFLGPEGMLNVATKLGELARQARELIDQLRMEAYMEEFNKKILEEEKRMKEEEAPPEDIAEELKEELEDVLEEEKEEKKEDESGKTPGNASNGTSERA
ncbi:preprotein translocase subunit TatA [Aquifex aeolicus]|uniref:preprotein translocase subunit TatA n=1 Tax=Aquifex aeolicus TaxID=63363 RepID=UPI0003063D20|nr:preprotein translocase subunit TatA [Aquifex aeolicus]